MPIYKEQFQKIMNKMQFVYATIQTKDVIVQYPFYADPSMVEAVKVMVVQIGERAGKSGEAWGGTIVNVYVETLVDLNLEDIKALCGNTRPDVLATPEDLAMLHATPVAPLAVYGGAFQAAEEISNNMVRHMKHFVEGSNGKREEVHKRLVNIMPSIFSATFSSEPTSVH